jgi:Flp pilus assembly protein TadD
MAVLEAAEINNQALSLSRQGNYADAENLHLQALHIKLDAVGENDLTTATTRNALGELYLKMGKITDAEEQLKKAVSVRMRNGPAYDAAVSVKNLGQVHEVKGDFEEARRVRLSHPADIMVCGNYDCPGETFDRSQLLACSRCKSAFYCGGACQAKDWRAGHKTFCKKRA